MKQYRWAIPFVAILLGLVGIALVNKGAFGLTLFVLLPIIAGGLGAAFFNPPTSGRAAFTGALTGLAGSLAFLFVGVEGVICVVMSWPLVAPLGAIGGLVAHA